MPNVPDLSGSALDDRYELHAVIGEGAFGRVYEGRDRRLDRPVAVKVIKPWWAADPAWVTDFERETRLLARISNPGIVQIFDVGSGPEGPYYVSELVRGENLAQRLAEGPIAPWKAADIAAQLCRALAGAHAQRIVHRDVKPPNILLSTTGQVKVGDFGVAGLAEGSSGAGSATIVGTPAYMAPEQSRGRPVTPATDVYSAGVVLYEMVAGTRPFLADSMVELALCHLQDPPPRLPESVPAPLRAIVARALAKDPAERFADCGEMADALVDARRRAGERARGRSSGRAGGRAKRHAPLKRRAASASGSSAPTSTAVLERPVAPERPAATAGEGPLGPGRPAAAATAVAAGGRKPPARPRWSSTPPRRPGQTAVAHRAGDTRPAPLVSPRSEHNPPARRRAIGALAAAVALVGAMAAAALLIGHGFGSAAHANVPRTRVPDVTGMSSARAAAGLKARHLHAHTVTVPWPGHAAGTVRSESRVAKWVRRGSTVTLNVAEVPTWKTVTTFAGTSSPVFAIKGSKFRLVYDISHEKSCTLWVFCQRTSADVLNAGSGSTVDGFDLSDGTGEAQDFATGPGSYAVKVNPSSGDARWSFTVQDWY